MKKVLLSLIAMAGFTGMAFAGNGTETNPYTVDELLEMGTPTSAVSNVYVVGYIVGSVDGQVYATGSNFSTANASTTNIIIASSSAETDPNYAMPVQLPAGDVRNALNLSANPQNLGHQVILFGSWEKYFGVNGFKSVTSYTWVGDAPVDGGSTGGTTGGTLLSNNIDDCTIDNVVMPSDLNYVWTWDSSYKCAKASAYVNGTRYVVDSYLITPDITLDADATTLSFEQAINYLDGHNELLNVYVREGASGAWQNVTVGNRPAGSDWTFVTSTIDVSAFAGKTVQIGFRYQATAETAPTWEVRNLSAGAAGGDTPSTENGTLEHPLTVDQFLAMGVPSSAIPNTYVNGYIVGYINGMNISNAVFGGAIDDQNQTNLLLAGSSTENNTDYCIAVQLPAGDIRAALNLYANPDNLGKQVTLCGSHEKYFGVNGLKSLTGYWWGDSLVEGIYDEAPVVYVVNGNIIAPEGAEVYSLNGVRCNAQNLAQGVYIVRVNGKAVKVLVK